MMEWLGGLLAGAHLSGHVPNLSSRSDLDERIRAVEIRLQALEERFEAIETASDLRPTASDW
jgi:hypothetical protein